jgi:hypothetical protein
MRAYKEKHRYLSDTGREIPVEIFYEIDLPNASVDERLKLGGFNRGASESTEITTLCPIYEPRRRFKPRHVMLSFSNNRALKVIVRTHQQWVDLVNNDPRVVYAYGEGGCPIKFSN